MRHTNRKRIELTWPCKTCTHAAEYHALDAARPRCTVDECACTWYARADGVKAGDAIALVRKRETL